MLELSMMLPIKVQMVDYLFPRRSGVILRKRRAAGNYLCRKGRLTIQEEERIL